MSVSASDERYGLVVALLASDNPVVAREQTQYYFKCSSCRWFGPLTTDELSNVRVNELGSSPCPRCGQPGYIDPAAPPRASMTTWLVVGAVAAAVAVAVVFNL